MPSHRNLSLKAMPKGEKNGRKQSVLKKNVQKKKSRFKGIQKQKKLPVDLTRNAGGEITFVGEDDVVSEPPAASASSRKIVPECEETSSDESVYDTKGEIPEGYRLISLDSLKEFAKRIHSNSTCASGEIIVIITLSVHLICVLFCLCFFSAI